MPDNQLTAEEVIAEIRSIAECLSVRGFRPGHISKSLKYRVRNFTLKTGMPLFGLWADHRKYKTEPGIVVISGRPVQITEPGIVILNGRPFQLHVTKTDDTHVDDTIAEICQELGECLFLVNWKELVRCEITPEYHDWTPEVAEAAICRAAGRIPVLCDQLEVATGIKPQKSVPFDIRNEWVLRREAVGETVEDQMTAMFKKDTRIADLTSPEIAEILGCTAQAVRKSDNKIWKMFQEEKGRRKALLSQKIRPLRTESNDDD